MDIKAYRWLAVDDFGNELGVCSICSTKTTFSDCVVLQKPLDHIREGTLYKIPTGKQHNLGGGSERMIYEVDTEGVVVQVTLPIVLEHQLDFAVAHCAELKGWSGVISSNGPHGATTTKKKTHSRFLITLALSLSFIPWWTE